MRNLKISILAGILSISAVVFIGNYLNSDSGTPDKKQSNNFVLETPSEYVPYQYTEEDYRSLEEENSLDVSQSFSDHVVFGSLKELEGYADVILIGTPKNNFLEDDYANYYYFDEERKMNMLISFSTLSEINIKKVLKGKEIVQGSQVKVVQSGISVVKNDSEEYIMKDEHSYSINKGADYIFFLKLPKEGAKINKDVYLSEYLHLAACAGSQCQINIDGRDKELAAMGYKNRYPSKNGEKSLSENIREDALKKYQKEIEELGIPIAWEVELSEEDLTDATVME